MSEKSHLRVALPWLRDALVEAHASRSLPPLRSLAWLAGRGNVLRLDGSWRRWLLGAAGAGVAQTFDGWPAGPTLAALAGTDTGGACTWGIAQPVHLAAGLDHVRLAALVDAVPGAEEAAALSATIRGHFAGDAFELLDFVEGAWVVRCDESLDVATRDPLELIGRNIHDFMPAGPGGGRVRSWMNELQMLLHDHPVNATRERQRRLPINGLWLWGFGPSGQRPSMAHESIAKWEMRADDLWLRAWWKLQNGTLSPLAVPDPDAHQDSLMALTHPPTGDPAEALAEIDSSLLSRLQQAMQRGRLRRTEVLIGDRVIRLDSNARWRFWRSAIDVTALASET
jgi:hypothetical protein